MKTTEVLEEIVSLASNTAFLLPSSNCYVIKEILFTVKSNIVSI